MTDSTRTPAQGDDQYTKPVKTKKSPRIGKSFSSRNPLPIGAIGLVFLIALMYAAFNAASLPLIGGGTEFTAYFTESANLKADSDVRIAGVKVGKVSDVVISGDRRECGATPPCVKVTFTVKDGFVGNQSRIDIKIKTLLGAKYLSIDSIGANGQDPSIPIPHKAPDGTTRTTAPYDIYPAFSALTRTVDKINTADLAKAFRTLASDFSGTPQSVRPLVTGLSRLSTTIASRDAQLHELLSRANQVTGILADRSGDLQELFHDGNLLLQELNARRAEIHSLLINTVTLSTQLRGLVSDNQKTIGPLLDNLTQVLNLLRANQTSLDRGLALLGPFYRLFNNVIGNGRWFDNYIQNLSGPGVICLVLGGGCS
jgi:phospholipid/cholesterol/gamma-HCH transport system substrate-binding protein